MSELQQIGAIPAEPEDYTSRFEQLDRFLVHGDFDSHMELYNEFLGRNESQNALGSIKTLIDWVQRHKGEVPSEIEVLSYYAAMGAYRKSDNIAAAESCRKEAENIVLSARKLDNDPKKMAALGRLAEDNGQLPLARICYFSVLQNPKAPLELVLKTATHCVSSAPSLALVEALSNSYQLHQGHAELRFCRLLCSLSVHKVPIKKYVERRGEARREVGIGAWHRAKVLLEDCLNEFEDDAEVLQMMGETMTKLGSPSDAVEHFARAYALDSLNPEVALKLIGQLIQMGEFERAMNVGVQALDIQALSAKQRSELHWVIATGLRALGRDMESLDHVSKAVSFDPWSRNSIALALRFGEPKSILLPNDQAIADFDLEAGRLQGLSKQTEDKLVARARVALDSGFVEYAWILAKALFVEKPYDPNMRSFLATVGASWNSRSALHQLLLLLRSQERSFDVLTLALVACEMSKEAGDWLCFRQWRDIATSEGLPRHHSRSQVLFFEALDISLQGQDLIRAQALLESAMEMVEEGTSVPLEWKALQVYLLVCQGDHAEGQKWARELDVPSTSLASLFFGIKALARSPKGKPNSFLEEFFRRPVRTPLEQMMVEEIHRSFGSEVPGQLARLVC
jgi:tetratricopeptide (TPR) repeat protein